MQVTRRLKEIIGWQCHSVWGAGRRELSCAVKIDDLNCLFTNGGQEEMTLVQMGGRKACVAKIRLDSWIQIFLCAHRAKINPLPSFIILAGHNRLFLYLFSRNAKWLGWELTLWSGWGPSGIIHRQAHHNGRQRCGKNQSKRSGGNGSWPVPESDWKPRFA